MKPHFTLFGIPVWVRASFFIVTVMLGATTGTTIQSLALWTGIVFFSVMAHELGHAFMGRAFGLAPSIQLVGMGGLTSWVGGRNVGPGRSLLISLAGPAVGLVMGTAALLLGATRDGLTPLLHDAGNDFVWVNLIWSVFNLLPMMPLDGGNAMRSVVALTKIGDSELIARGVSLVTGGVVGFLSIWVGYFWGVILVAMYTVQNFQGIRARLASRGDEAVLKELSEGYPKWLAARDGASMIRAGTQARTTAKTAQLLAYATEVVGMGQCLSGDPRSGLATLQAMPQGYAPGRSVLLFVLEAAHEYAAAKQVLYDLIVDNDTPELRAKLAEIEEKEKRFALGRMVLSDPRAPELDADAFDAARRVADAENRHAEAAYVGTLLFDKAKDADLAFQIAREWGKAREPAKVGEWLSAAAALGFRDVAQVDHCPDFFSMHGASPFQAGRARVAEASGTS